MSDAVAEPRSLFNLAMTDGVDLAIRRGGNPDGVRLYLSNGNGFAIDGYRVFWQPLLDKFDVILFDMRNHGRNAPSGADGHSYQQMARDLGSVFHGVEERLGHRPSVGVFHSMSARAAMKHAVQMEWVWDALVLFDPPNVPLPGHEHYEVMRAFETRLMKWALQRQESFSSPEELRQAYAGNRGQSRWADAARNDMAKAILSPDGKGRFTLTCRRELEASIYLAALTMDFWPPASAFGGPFKLIGADPDAPGAPPTGIANRALANEGGYEYESIADSGHLSQIERPEACRDAMLTFLRKYQLA